MYRYRGETWVNKIESHQRAPSTSSGAIGWYNVSDVLGWRRSVTPNGGARSPSRGNSRAASREGSPVGGMHNGQSYLAGSPTGGRVSIYKTDHGPVPTPRNASPHARKSIEVSLYGADPLKVADVMQWKDAKAYRRAVPEATPLHVNDFQPNTVQVAQISHPELEGSATFRDGLKFPYIKKGTGVSGDIHNGAATQRVAPNGRLAVVESTPFRGSGVPGPPQSRGSRSRASRLDHFKSSSRGQSSQGGAKSMSPFRGRTPNTPTGSHVNEKFFNFDYITPWKPYDEQKKKKPWTKLPWTKFTLYGQ